MDRKIILAFTILIGGTGWIWLYLQNWKIALAVHLIIWSNNLMGKFS